MNRILFEKSEIIDGCATLADFRAEHILKVLHGEVGQILKTGEIDALIGTSEITAIGGGKVSVKVNHFEESVAPWFDLVLAPPRPRVMKRLLPQLAALGVGRIILVGAEKVEKDFWGATLLKDEVNRPLLIDALMQAGTSILPKIEIWKSFRRWAREGVGGLGRGARYVAHPYGESAVSRPVIGADEGSGERTTIAIGPEGGWTESEVETLEANGFKRYSLGKRILRSDTATVAVIAQLMKGR